MKQIILISVIIFFIGNMTNAQLNMDYKRFLKKHKISKTDDSFVYGNNKMSYVHQIPDKKHKTLLLIVNTNNKITSVTYLFPLSQEAFIKEYCRKTGYVSEYADNAGRFWYSTINKRVLFRYYIMKGVDENGYPDIPTDVAIEFNSLNNSYKFDTGLNK